MRRHIFRASIAPLIAAAIVALVPSASVAQVAPVVPGVVTLSDAEKAELLMRNEETRKHEALEALVPTTSSDTGRQIHGEVGAMIGSNGSRAAYGAASIPLGENGGAAVSFESSRYRSR